MLKSSGRRGYSQIDLKQRYPFLVFYLSALAFSIVLVFANYPPSLWQLRLDMLAAVTDVFGLWNFYRLFALTDERQRDINNRSLRFGFIATLAVALTGGLIRGFVSPVVSCVDVLAIMVIAWSLGLILYSWRYR